MTTMSIALPGIPAGGIDSPPVLSGAARRGIRSLVAVAAFLVAFVVVLAVSALTDHQGAVASMLEASDPTSALTAASARPRQINWLMTLEAWGADAKWQQAGVVTQIGGYSLIDVRVNVGDQVKTGEFLASLYPALLRADQAEVNRLRLRYTNIVVPDDGVISSRIAVISAGSAQFRAIHHNRLEWHGDSTAIQLAQIVSSQHVKLIRS